MIGMPLRELLIVPGLDRLFLLCLGPVASHRLLALHRSLHCLEALLQQCWDDRTSCNAAEAALELLQTIRAPVPSKRVEWLLNELYVMTAAPGGLGSIAGRSLLDVAVERRLRPVIPLLRMRGCGLEFLDNLSAESMVRADDSEAVAAYLEAGMSADARANAGRSLLMVAASAQAREVVQLLLAWKADVHQRSGFGGWTALMWAAHRGWEEGCEMLLAAGSRQGDQNDLGLTVAEIARRMGHTTTEQALLSAELRCNSSV
mmetsp:Transcript_85466/g.265950  ORF Transcript_85466/g.265950 Transcript_85466/m.265950 type:complete len:260 (-) Transcript_85466:270-1049(-)